MVEEWNHHIMMVLRMKLTMSGLILNHNLNDAKTLLMKIVTFEAEGVEAVEEEERGLRVFENKLVGVANHGTNVGDVSTDELTGEADVGAGVEDFLESANDEGHKNADFDVGKDLFAFHNWSKMQVQEDETILDEVPEGHSLKAKVNQDLEEHKKVEPKEGEEVADSLVEVVEVGDNLAKAAVESLEEFEAIDVEASDIEIDKLT